MDKKIIFAYLWREILRLGFHPSGDKEQKSWLVQYGKSLKDFWEVDHQDFPSLEKGAFKGNLSCSPGLNMFLTYSISGPSKFVVAFEYKTIHGMELMWIHDVDEAYFRFPVQTFLTLHNQRNPALRDIRDSDIKVVINGLLCHPRAHQHIESPINKHEIRVGGGIDNAFLFLFHLRYQLCPIPGKREAETLSNNFYGRPSDGSLDDSITKIEGRLSKVINDIRITKTA